MVRSGRGRGRRWRQASLHVACVTVTSTYNFSGLCHNYCLDTLGLGLDVQTALLQQRNSGLAAGFMVFILDFYAMRMSLY